MMTPIRFLLILLFSSSAVFAQIPSKYQPMYNFLDTKLAAVHDSIRANWNRVRSPVAFAVELTFANGNRGEDLLKATTLQGVALQLDAIRSLGVDAATVAVAYPLLKPSFPRSAEYAQFYRSVAALVRSRGMKLLAKGCTIFADTAYSSLHVDYSGLTMEQFKTDLRQMTDSLLSIMRPDFFTILNEPGTQAGNTGLAFTPQNFSELIAFVAVNLDKRGAKIGAGSGAWENLDYPTRLAQIPELDYLDMHIYPINRTYFPGAANQICQIARQAGKDVAIGEAWLYKSLDSELGGGIATSSKIYARDVYSFWSPLDQRFIESVFMLAESRQMAFASFFWARYLFAYLDWDASMDALVPAQLFLRAEQAATPNLFTKTPSSTGQKLKDLLASLTSVEDTIAVDSIRVQVYPNPAGATAPYVMLVLTEDQYVQLTVWDLLGRQVAELFEGSLFRRTYRFQITQPLQQGYYFVVMRTDNRQIITRLVKL
jgi:hypothetical protein